MLAIHNNLSKIIKWLIEYNIKKINGDSLLNKNKAINRNNSEIVELSIDYCDIFFLSNYSFIFFFIYIILFKFFLFKTSILKKA